MSFHRRGLLIIEHLSPYSDGHREILQCRWIGHIYYLRFLLQSMLYWCFALDLVLRRFHGYNASYPCTFSAIIALINMHGFFMKSVSACF